MLTIRSIFGPPTFTKTLKPVLAVLRSLGIRIVIYLDDMLLLHQRSSVLRAMFAQVVDFLERLGFLLKKEKCSTTPCQQILFLGAQLDSTTMTLSLPQPKLMNILDTCSHLLAQRTVAVNVLSTLIGRMSHASQTGILLAPLHYRGLQRVHLQAVLQYGHRRRVLVPLTSQALDDLNWWVLDSSHANGCPIQVPPIDTTIWSDASKTGWGSNVPGDIHWGPLGCRRGEGAHQCLGVTSSNTSPEGILATSAPGTKTCSLANRQHHSSGIHKQEGRYTLPVLTAQAL